MRKNHPAFQLCMVERGVSMKLKPKTAPAPSRASIQSRLDSIDTTLGLVREGQTNAPKPVTRTLMVLFLAGALIALLAMVTYLFFQVENASVLGWSIFRATDSVDLAPIIHELDTISDRLAVLSLPAEPPAEMAPLSLASDAALEKKIDTLTALLADLIQRSGGVAQTDAGTLIAPELAKSTDPRPPTSSLTGLMSGLVTWGFAVLLTVPFLAGKLSVLLAQSASFPVRVLSAAIILVSITAAVVAIGSMAMSLYMELTADLKWLAPIFLAGPALSAALKAALHWEGRNIGTLWSVVVHVMGFAFFLLLFLLLVQVEGNCDAFDIVCKAYVLFESVEISRYIVSFAILGFAVLLYVFAATMTIAKLSQRPPS